MFLMREVSPWCGPGLSAKVTNQVVIACEPTTVAVLTRRRHFLPVVMRSRPPRKESFLGPLGFNSPNTAQRHALHVERTAEKAFMLSDRV